MSSKQSFTPVHKHEYTERVIPSTCSERGYTLHVCECGDEYRDNYLPLADHDFRPAETVAPTCTAPGKSLFACAICGAKKEEPIPATGHRFGATETTVYPGCEENGEGKRTCSLCGAVERVAVPPTGHHFDEWFEQKKAGCETEGEQIRQCSRCGKTETRALPALGHAFTEWSISKTDPNKDERYCRRCGLSETREGQSAGTLFVDGMTALQNKQYDLAREKLRLAAEKGLPEAQYEYGVLLRDAPDKKGADVDAAIGWLKKSAEQNYAPAMVALANTYSEMKRDRKQAMVWYRKAAEKGDKNAAEILRRERVVLSEFLVILFLQFLAALLFHGVVFPASETESSILFLLGMLIEIGLFSLYVYLAEKKEPRRTDPAKLFYPLYSIVSMLICIFSIVSFAVAIAVS